MRWFVNLLSTGLLTLAAVVFALGLARVIFPEWKVATDEELGLVFYAALILAFALLASILLDLIKPPDDRS